MKYLEAEGMHNPLVAAEADAAAAPCASRSVPARTRTTLRVALDELALLATITTADSEAASRPMPCHSAYALLLDYALLRQRKHSPRH